jgi:hypothetical protein
MMMMTATPPTACDITNKLIDYLDMTDSSATVPKVLDYCVELGASKADIAAALEAAAKWLHELVQIKAERADAPDALRRKVLDAG